MNEDIGKQIADFADMMTNNYKEKQESFEHRVKMNMNQNNVNNKKGTLKFLIDNCDSIVSAKVFSTDLGFDEFEIKINLSDSTKNERDLLFSFRETNKNTNLIFI